MVEALEQEGLIRKREPYTHTVPFSHRSGRADRAADLAPVVHAHGRAGASRRSRPCAPARSRSTPSAGRACTSTGSRTSGPGASRASCGGDTGCRSGTATRATRPSSRVEAPERCGTCDGELRRDEDVLDTWFSSALWPFATLGWPARHAGAARLLPDRRARHRARHHLPVGRAHGDDGARVRAATSRSTDVYITSIIQAPDGRRMSKSLGTGIDPLDEIEAHGADAVRFGLLAMSSSQDVRYSAEKIQQGQQLANKMWNASRLVLLNAADVEPAPRPRDGRGPLDPVAPAARDRAHGASRSSATTSRTRRSTCTRSSRASFCDWYLEMVKPRLYERRGGGLGDAAATCSAQTLALAHPMLPFVTEEIHSFVPGAERDLAVQPVPRAPTSAARRGGRARGGGGDRGGAPAAQLPRLGGRAAGGAHPGTAGRRRRRHERLARTRSAASRASTSARRRQPTARSSARSGSRARPSRCCRATRSTRPRRARASRPSATRLRAEIERARGKLANKGFTDKAPPQLVQAERDKLERFEARAGRARGVGSMDRACRRRARCATPSATSTRWRCSACASGSSGCGG